MGDNPSRPIVHSYTDLWEYACCGEPVSVGDEITVRRIIDPGHANKVYGHIVPVDWYVGYHVFDDTEGPVESHPVRVLALWEAHSELGYHAEAGDPPDNGYYAPLPGTGRLTPIETMVTWDEAWDLAFADPRADYTPVEPRGWVMRLEVLDAEG
ncbi:MAG: hypothetical protein LWW86_04445 [Micrococcales bacterium]|nr:hypothetical protein [Micrococcales bacterium]